MRRRKSKPDCGEKLGDSSLQKKERARAALDLARATSERLWLEHKAYCKTLNPDRDVVGPEEKNLLREASEWQRRVYVAEHALFRAEHGTPGIVGAHEDYRWLTMADHDITPLLIVCPGIVVGKYLGVTSIDGGPLRPTENEKHAGWWTSEAGRVLQGTVSGGAEYREDWKVAWSPRIASIHGLPNESHDECCAGFDEWYVFDRQVDAVEVESFINWGGFRLYDPRYQ